MTVTLNINAKETAADAGATVFECAEKMGVRVPTSCFEQGKCRECMVEVAEGMEHLSPHTEEEAHLGGSFRLSCRAKIASDEGRIRCHTMRRGAMHIEDRGDASVTARVDQPLDPAVRRENGLILLDGEVIAESSGPIHGVAVDLGTTTVVMRLVDLETGQIRATQSFENPQRFGGSDVMARIRYDTEHKGKLLQRTLLGYMTHAIEAFPCKPETIYEMVVAGNSTMRDLLFGLPVETIGQKPYRSVTEHELMEGSRSTTSLESTAKKLRLPMHPRARVYGMPLISGHVGADAAACMLAVDLAQEELPVALMDIGTNTELIVGNRHKLLAASCPAGPAFEGGEIACGMPGLEGAIERVAIRDGRIDLGTVGGGAAEGICGSGLVDLLSELLRTGRMSELGRFEDEKERFDLDAAGSIFLHENDVSLLAQAKAANVAGLNIVLDAYGMSFDDIERFYLAGGFARHIDVAAARRIGLIPNLPDEKIVQIGNASIEGATLALRSMTRRREAEKLVREITHVELETHPNFFDYFVDACQYVPVETDNVARAS